jgi:anthranilate/para-aminobenzoate synthase component II
MVNKLKNKPVAIISSGNNANYQNLPMFEYNGVFEIIRQSQIPILGICCGHQLACMAYGYTFVRSMGWSDITSLTLDEHKKMTTITIKKDLPIFEGIPNPFTVPEVHSWAVSPLSLPEDYEITSESTYIQTIKSKTKFLYGEQFHAEIKTDYNEATPYLVNFLKMALGK